MAPRIPPLSADERDEKAKELLAGVSAADGSVLNIFATLVRHPRLYRRWLPFGGVLLSGSIPPRDRELLILRTAWRCGSDYEWGQHRTIAADAGLTDDEIDRVAATPAGAASGGAAAPGWEAFDATLLDAADELIDDHVIDDTTWSVLAGRYDEPQLIELPMLVGHYQLLAGALRTFGVQREPGVGGFDS